MSKLISGTKSAGLVPFALQMVVRISSSLKPSLETRKKVLAVVVGTVKTYVIVCTHKAPTELSELANISVKMYDTRAPPKSSFIELCLELLLVE